VDAVGVTRYSYDTVGQVLSEDGPWADDTVSYAYTNRLRNGLSLQAPNADPWTEGYGYDAAKRLRSLSSRAGAFAYTYTSVQAGSMGSLVTKLLLPGNAFITNSFDGNARLLSTAGDQLLTEDGPWGSDTVTNTYVNRLRVAMALGQPTGAWTNGFAHDTGARLYQVRTPAGNFNYSYGAGSASRLPLQLLLPNTSYITNTYDRVARLTGTFLKNSGNSTLDSATYGYSLSGQRLTFTNAAGTYVQYSYDNISQLKVGTSSVSSENRGYAYDKAWNLNWLTNNGSASAFQVDVKNELTNAPDGNCTADTNGNLLTSGGNRYQYTYDDENRLVYWQDNGARFFPLLTQFVYDGLGRLRIRYEYEQSTTRPQGPSSPDGSWTLISETFYIYDGNRVIQERDINNNPTVSYTRGIDLSATLEGAGGIGGLLARSDGYSAGNWTDHNYYHADGNGNITYLVNASQTLAASYRYDPFGNTISSSGSLAAANVYRFSSKECHVNSGMYYYLYRFYDPNLQRWINRDPSGEDGGLNLYAYVGNILVNEIDPLGLTWGSNWNFFWDWALGRGQRNRNYGPNSTETQEMQDSPGGNALRDAFYKNGCKNVNNFGYGTARAAWDTLPHPSTTGAQVGGFGGAIAVDNGNGTVTFTIPNVAGTHSFFYHIVPDRSSPTGPGSNIRQTFQWTEPIDKSKCACPPK
jgi:RHS repeat-associated protein